MAKRYRKKPVVIEAVQYVPENVEELTAWLPFQLYMTNDDSLKIPTLEGEMQGQIGDYIIRGVHGEFYPCKPDIFDATYEEVVE